MIPGFISPIVDPTLIALTSLVVVTEAEIDCELDQQGHKTEVVDAERQRPSDQTDYRETLQNPSE